MNYTWWGYLHINGQINVKRYYKDSGGELDIQDALKSPFVQRVFGPFPAVDKESAIRHIKMEL